MNVKFWYPDRQYLAHKQEFDDEMQRVLSEGKLVLQEDMNKFENSLAKYLGVSNVVSCASGTDALILSLKVSRIGQFDEVLCPSYTFRATLEAIHHVGAKPVLYDLDGRYEHLVTKRTAAIIPAHLEGYVREDMPEVADFCQKNCLTLIEDSCQAIGAAPLHGITAAYSFYPAKILGCFGDGGAIATNDDSVALHLRNIRNHYKDDWGYGFGYNSRLDNLQAAVLNVKMKYLSDSLFKRKRIAMMYDQNLMGVGLPKVRAVYQDYVITLPDSFKRDNLHEYLSSKGIQTMKNEYPFPEAVRKGLLAEAYEISSLRIPCTPEHTDEEIEYVIEAINSYVG